MLTFVSHWRFSHFIAWQIRYSILSYFPFQLKSKCCLHEWIRLDISLKVQFLCNHMRVVVGERREQKRRWFIMKMQKRYFSMYISEIWCQCLRGLLSASCGKGWKLGLTNWITGRRGEEIKASVGKRREREGELNRDWFIWWREDWGRRGRVNQADDSRRL